MAVGMEPGKPLWYYAVLFVFTLINLDHDFIYTVIRKVLISLKATNSSSNVNCLRG